MPRRSLPQVSRSSNLQAHGHIHSSLMMVDVVITGVSGRAKMAEALRGFAGLPRKVERERGSLADRGERRRGVARKAGNSWAT